MGHREKIQVQEDGSYRRQKRKTRDKDNGSRSIDKDNGKRRTRNIHTAVKVAILAFARVPFLPSVTKT